MTTNPDSWVMYEGRRLVNAPPKGQRGFISIPPEERFESYVDRNGSISALVPGLGPCWLWRGQVNKSGYGVLSVGGRHRLAHRWAYEHRFGSIAKGLTLDHLCRTSICVNPEHCEPVTAGVNVKRGGKSLITHCPQGHPYDAANTVVSRGRRHCRECRKSARHQRQNADYWRAYRARKRTAQA